MKIQSYSKTPVDAAKATRFNERILQTLDIKWKVYPPNNPSKAYKLWVKNKAHIEWMIPKLMVMHSDELFRVREAINVGEVPAMFADIINFISNNMEEIRFTGEFTVENYIPFNYDENEKMKVKRPKVGVPGIPSSLQQFVKDINNVKSN